MYVQWKTVLKRKSDIQGQFPERFDVSPEHKAMSLYQEVCSQFSSQTVCTKHATAWTSYHEVIYGKGL